MAAQTPRTVVVTGLGLVSPCGLGREASWEALVGGESGIGAITKFDASGYPSRIAGEVRGFDPLSVVERRDRATVDPFELYALAAAEEALRDSGLKITEELAPRVGTQIGVGLGGIASLERDHESLLARGPRRVSPYLVPMMIPNMAASHVSMRLGARGPCHGVATACASGAHALGEAARWVAAGHADVVFAGGAEAAVTPLSLAGFCSMRALSTRNDEPERASRPFDADRDGFVLAEGAAVAVLEAAEHALGRGASIYAVLAGYGSTADAHHITQPDPEGRGQIACMRRALADAEVAPERLGYVNAHGTSTQQNDRAEAAALRVVLGDAAEQVPVSSTKSATGHMLGAAGAFEAAVCALAVHRGAIPPTLNLERPDPECSLAHVRETMHRPLEAAMTNSFGFGGTNATLVFRRWNGEEGS